MLDRNTATQRLTIAREGFWFSSGAYGLLTKEPSRSQLAALIIRILEAGTVSVTQAAVQPVPGIGYQVGFNAGLSESSARQIVEYSFRQIVLQSFEPTRDYVAGNGLSIAGASWYEFARHYGSAIAHNGRWEIRSSKGLPLTWKNKTVDASMNGNSIDDYLSWYEGLQLCAQMINFVSAGIV